RVRINDEVREAVDEQRQTGRLQIRRGQCNPAGQENTHAERREQAPWRVELHAFATARSAAALRSCGRRASSSARTSCSLAMVKPCSASTGTATLIHTSERRRE